MKGGRRSCPVACLGRIAAHHRQEDGSYNVLWMGLCRVRLLDELPAMTSFREARVEVLEDVYPSAERRGHRPP